MNLLSCIFHLGPRLGWRYWRIGRAFRNDPQLARRCAFQYNTEAARAWAKSDRKYAVLLWWFAKEILDRNPPHGR